MLVHFNPHLMVVLFLMCFVWLVFLSVGPCLWLSNRNGMKVGQPLTK